MEKSQGSWSGKTSPEHSQATEARTSEASSKRSSALQSRTFLFLDLRKRNGHTPEPSWETDTRSLGAPWMPNTGESPNEDVESTLSQILEVQAHPKYSLSQKACLGILRRAETRGKTLPEILRIALEKQAGILSGGGYCSPIENHPQDCRVQLSEDGKVQTLTGKMGTGGGNVPLLLEGKPEDDCLTPWDVQSRRIYDSEGKWSSLYAGEGGGHGYVAIPSEEAATLRERAGHDGGGKGPLIQQELSGTLKQVNDQTVFQPQAFGIGSYYSGGMLSDNPNVGYYEAKTARTIDTSGGDPTRHQGGIAVVAFEPGAASRVGSHVYEDGKSGTLRAKPGDNQQAVVIPIEGNGARPSHLGAGFSESDKMYTLNSTEQHAVAYAVGRDNCTAEEERAQTLTSEEVPGSVAHPVFPEISGTLTAKMAKGTGGPAGDECQNLVLDYIVRRLTPLECCRLQGFPDGWTDGLRQEDADKKEVRFWLDVWLEHWAVVGRKNGIKRPKDEKAVRRWLAGEPSDSDQYKLWGNGIALPCAYFVFQGIREVLNGSAV